MFTVIALLFTADPHFVVENKIPVAFIVENRIHVDPLRSIVDDALADPVLRARLLREIEATLGDGKIIPAVAAAAAPTPMADVNLALAMLPKPETGFVDFGCGDGRVLIAAAENPEWAGIPIYGVEIDPARAAACRERVRSLGLSQRITIITGDCRSVDVKADMAYVFLYEGLLAEMLPKFQAMAAVVSRKHRPPGLPVSSSGDFWVYKRPVAAVQSVAVYPRVAYWNGVAYTGPNPGCNCEMCRSIVSQLKTPVVQQQVAASTQPTKAATGHYVKRCNGRQCWFEWVPDR